MKSEIKNNNSLGIIAKTLGVSLIINFYYVSIYFMSKNLNLAGGFAKIIYYFLGTIALFFYTLFFRDIGLLVVKTLFFGYGISYFLNVGMLLGFISSIISQIIIAILSNIYYTQKKTQIKFKI